MILVDTSVWVGLLRQSATPPVARLRQLLLDGETLIAPVVLQEMLQGARSQADLSRLREHFSALPMLEHRATTYALAGTLYARCRWAGITPRSPHDCLIAATAIEHGVPLLHDDRDFERIAGIEPGLRLLAS
ncbi:MAG: PIN domain nuclease [Xanthomonadaceae bacterium]|nr:PIN domain nuclease [Xanthomonadaceae bacterium]MDP2185407.1 PIN domain nuclease [Xanthomonadales bacterium]MDZ4116827.1 PIN domain nuclease [Xanthomonadaceae bacterium]MDZ4379212.1 PIN domain nuclease [Xanthomonadaceae bacterium]